jgi:hypothetical protein
MLVLQICSFVIAKHSNLCSRLADKKITERSYGEL